MKRARLEILNQGLAHSSFTTVIQMHATAAFGTVAIFNVSSDQYCQAKSNYQLLVT